MKEFDDFYEVMKRVVAECPWDKKQTHQSLRQYFIEEVYEVIDTIDDLDYVGMQEELGDVLIQIIFHSILAENNDKFNINDVINTVKDKLVRRHPHVFGDTKVADAAEVMKNWEQIKIKEKQKDSDTIKSVLDGVPKHLPALIKAYRVQTKAGRVGFDWKTQFESSINTKEGLNSDYKTNVIDKILEKIREEITEFEETIVNNDRVEMENELGDILFSIVNLSRKIDINPEDALRKSTSKFDKRFKFIEKSLIEKGGNVNDADDEELDRLWELSKIKK